MNQANVTDDGVLHPPQDQQNIMNNIITNSPYDPISTFGSDFQQMKMAIVGNTSSISTNNPFIKVNIKPTVIQSVAIPVILNNKNSGMSFPSKITDLSLINLLLDNSDDYPYSEERRLFYVALTRCKKKVFLLSISNNKSVFIKEIEKYISS